MPASHLSQAAMPSAEATVPGGHFVQPEDPSLENVPKAQSRHAVTECAPSSSKNVPAGHNEQVDAPSTWENVPATRHHPQSAQMRQHIPDAVTEILPAPSSVHLPVKHVLHAHLTAMLNHITVIQTYSVHQRERA